MAPAAITALLIVSAAMELFGTATVAVNYWRGNKLGEMITRELVAEQSAAAAESPMEALLRETSIQAAPKAVQESQARLATLRVRVADFLTARTVLTLGLVVYGLGALAGLGAGLVALYH